MRITGVKTVLHDRRTDTLDVFGIEDGRLPMGVLVITTDEGIEGHCTLSFPGPGPEAIARQISRFLAPILIGADPLEIGRLWHRMQQIGRWYADPIAVGSVDIALWDIAGKAAGLPVHTLLGTCRHDGARVLLVGIAPERRGLRRRGRLLARAGVEGLQAPPADVAVPAPGGDDRRRRRSLRGGAGGGRRRHVPHARLVVVLLATPRRCGSAGRSSSSASSGTRTRCRSTTSTATSGSSSRCRSR